MKKSKNSYQVAKITKTFGYKGFVKIKSLSDFERIKKDKEFYFLKEDKKNILKIKSVKKTPSEYIVSFYGIETLEDAKNIKGNYLFTDEKPNLNDGQYHYQDLIGMDVFLTDGTNIGTVCDVLFNPSQETLKIKTNEGLIKMVPFVEVFIKEVSDKVVIDSIEGLL